MNNSAKTQSTPYLGELTPTEAATAMQAARLNALDLLDTAEILYSLKRFAHSVAFSILAMEEAGKLPLLKTIFLGFGGDRTQLWKAYRSHRAKTQSLNVGIETRIRSVFPDVPQSEAKEIGGLGPTPDELEISKQRAIYSDCLQSIDGLSCHLPRNGNWRQTAWERLCEAQVLVLALRDYPPDELEIWLKHAKEARLTGASPKSMLESLHKELLAKGHVKEGWWDTLLADIREASDTDAPQPRNEK